ncbi:transmembrane protein 273-like [Chelmon rostratus]|uniref:transmembrane protein 273-like n=1 Tax=Chelmon rostratus TaxID=109905 RepID=UPI001BE97AA8|nr:transmembrane protein 273-like [Chelmon rostratus]
MRAFQMRGCLSALIRAILITECLLRSVRGDGADAEEEVEIRYVLIGSGIGLFLVAGFIIVIVCIIRKQVHDNSTGPIKRPSQPHLLVLSNLSQSEPPVAAVSNAV